MKFPTKIKYILPTLIIATSITTNLPHKIKRKYNEIKYGYTLPQNMKTVNHEELIKTIKFNKIRYSPKKFKNIEFLEHFKNIKKKSKLNYKETLKKINTIEEAMTYCSHILKYGGNHFDSIQYNTNDYWASFKQIHKLKIDDCEGGAFAAAALLKDNKFPPYILTLFRKTKTNKTIGHATFIYKTNKNYYGSIGIVNEDNAYPKYKTIEALVNKITKHRKNKFLYYKIFDLNKQCPSFIDNNIDNKPTLENFTPIYLKK
jgi:hypothetical protein